MPLSNNSKSVLYQLAALVAIIMILFGEGRTVPCADCNDDADIGRASGAGERIRVAVHGPVHVPLANRIKDELSKTDVAVIGLPFPIMMDTYEALAAAQDSYLDVIAIAPSWLGTLAAANYLQPVPPGVQNRIDWTGIIPAVRSNAAWNGQFYAVPVDGDCHLLYYRKDLLESTVLKTWYKNEFGEDLRLPATWDELIITARRLNDRDNGQDGKKEYGVGIPYMRDYQAVWFFLDIYFSLLDDDYETYQRDNVVLLDKEAFVEAYRIYRDLRSAGPIAADLMTIEDVRKDFLDGLLVFALDWGDIGAKAIASGSATKYGFLRVPGSLRRWQPRQKKWTTYPSPVRRSFLAFGGWLLAVTNTSRNPEAAWNYVAHFADPSQSESLVSDPQGWINPYRFVHLDPDKWKHELDRGMVNEYLTIIQETYLDRGAVGDAHWVQAPSYYATLDHHLYEGLLDNRIAPEEVFERVSLEWTKLKKIFRDRDPK